MPLIALLAAPPEPIDGGPLTVVGRPLLDRQVRQVRHAGAARVLVIGPPLAGVEAVPDAASAAAAIGDEDSVLVLAPGLVADERIVAAVVAAAPALATFPDYGVERIDSASLAAGVAVYPGALVRRVVAGLGDWDLHSTLLRAAVGEGLARVDLGDLDLYAPARRRAVPLTWAAPATPAEAAAATTAVIAAAQKGVLDWPARFVHPPIEDGLVRLLGPTPVTPNMVTLLVAAISLAAGIAFATGWLWTGLILALVSGPLDGVDGKLARARIEYSRWGDLEHVLDKIAEYGWYLALAGHFAATGHGDAPWVLAVLIIVVALAEALAGEFYRRFTGAQLDDAGDFERRFRLIGGRRNTYFWTLIPFAALGLWYEGFVGIAAYAVVTFFVMQVRMFKRLGEYGRSSSARVAANYAATTYDFLPARRG